MPRPNKEWEKKYGGKKQQTKKYLLSMSDNVLSASEKLAGDRSEAQMIILQMCRKISSEPAFIMLDMDDMQMFGHRIVKAYHEWAGNDYVKLARGIKDRDASLIAFINKVQG
jgi:hypothetical protein